MRFSISKRNKIFPDVQREIILYLITMESKYRKEFLLIIAAVLEIVYMQVANNYIDDHVSLIIVSAG